MTLRTARALLALTAALLLTAASARAVPAPAAAQDWSRFGGPNGDFQLPETQLAREWPKAGPKKLWSQTLGKGYSGIVASESEVFTLYRDGDDDVAVALAAADGKVLWTHRYAAPSREGNMVQFGTGPHATPLLLDDRVITLGYTGVLKALDRKTGNPLWSHELVKDFGGDVLNWGYSASPILHQGRVLVLVGGDRHGAVAFAPGDGKVLWSSKPSTVSYATPIVIEAGGREQLVYYSKDALNGIDLADGAFLWSTSITNSWENHATMPIWGDDGVLWAVTQQDGAGRTLRLAGSGAETQVEQVWYNNRLRVHYWNSLRLGDTYYAAVGDGGGFLAGIDAASGKILWRKRGFVKANFLHTGNATLVLSEDGELSLVDLSRKGVKVLAKAQIFQSTTWTAPTMVDGILYVRDQEGIAAFDLAPEATAPAAAKAP